jgi:hypothetical protein
MSDFKSTNNERAAMMTALEYIESTGSVSVITVIIEEFHADEEMFWLTPSSSATTNVVAATLGTID